MAKPYVLPIRDCARIMGRTPDAIRAAGYSAVERGKYDISEIVAEEIKRARGTNRRETIETETALLLKERRAGLSAKNAERSGKLVNIDVVVDVVASHITAAKKKLMTLGISMSQSLAGEDSPKRIAEIVTGEIQSALQEISFDVAKFIVDEARRRLGAGMASTAEDDAQRVDRKKPRPKSRVRNRAR